MKRSLQGLARVASFVVLRVKDWGSPPDEAEYHHVLGRLTLSELKVLRAACAPDEPKDAAIAERVGLGTKTVQTHLGKVYRKLGVRGRMGMLRAAIRYGLVHVHVADLRDKEEG